MRGVRQKRQSILIIIIIIIFLRLTNNLQHPRTLINWLHLCHKQQPPIHSWLCMENNAPINFYAFQLKYFGTVMTTHHPIKHYDRLKFLGLWCAAVFSLHESFLPTSFKFQKPILRMRLMPSIRQYIVCLLICLNFEFYANLTNSK